MPITRNYNLEYVIEPWIYKTELSEQLAEKYEKMKKKQVDTGLKSNHWLEAKKNKDAAMQKLSRICWTWRKPL